MMERAPPDAGREVSPLPLWPPLAVGIVADAANGFPPLLAPLEELPIVGMAPLEELPIAGSVVRLGIVAADAPGLSPSLAKNGLAEAIPPAVATLDRLAPPIPDPPDPVPDSAPAVVALVVPRPPPKDASEPKEDEGPEGPEEDEGPEGPDELEGSEEEEEDEDDPDPCGLLGSMSEDRPLLNRSRVPPKKLASGRSNFSAPCAATPSGPSAVNVDWNA